MKPTASSPLFILLHFWLQNVRFRDCNSKKVWNFRVFSSLRFASWYCWWFRNPKQPPVGCIKPYEYWDMRISIYTTSTGECRISEPSTVSTLSKPTFVALASPSRAASSKARKHQASWQFLKTAQEMRETPFFFGGTPKKKMRWTFTQKKNQMIFFGG